MCLQIRACTASHENYLLWLECFKCATLVAVPQEQASEH